MRKKISYFHQVTSGLSEERWEEGRERERKNGRKGEGGRAEGRENVAREGKESEGNVWKEIDTVIGEEKRRGGWE